MDGELTNGSARGTDGPAPIVEVRNLVKRYGDVVALDHFDLRIEPGEIFGLLGPNGSGKTTAINCILQLLTFDKGDICLFGEPMTPTRYDLKRKIGVVPQNVALFEELTVRRTSTSSVPCTWTIGASGRGSWTRPSRSWASRTT